MQTGNWQLRAVFDLLFFFSISVILFNIIAGIIIDMFGALRDQTNEREDKLQNYCLVSGLSRFEIDNAAIKVQAMQEGSSGSRNALVSGGGYDEHIKDRHHIWDYMYFLFYLRSKDATEYTGPEKLIKHLDATHDVRWLPVGRVM